MTTGRWAKRAAGALLLASAIAGGVAAGYVLYARACVVNAIAEAADAAQLVARVNTTRVRRPGTFELKNLVVSSAERELRIQLRALVLRGTPWWTADPRIVSIELPAQRTELRLDGLRLDSKVYGEAELRNAARSPILQRAVVRFSNARLTSAEFAAPGLSGKLQLSSPAPLPATDVGGRITIHGPSAAAFLGVVGLRGVTAWLFPEALAGAFELDADVRQTSEGLSFANIRGRSGSIGIRGALTLTDRGPDGALLLTTSERSMGLRVVEGAWSPEHAPGAGWLEQHRRAASLEARLHDGASS